MARYITKRLFKPKKGIDLKSSEILRGEDYLTSANNVVWDDQSNLAKRPGTHLRVYGIPAHSGMVRFDTTDYVGSSKSEMIFIGAQTPSKLVKSTFTITNNSALPIVVSMLFDTVTSQYRFVVSGGAIANIALGTGLGGGDLSVAGLIAALPVTVPGTSVGGVTTVKAAFLDTKIVTIAVGGTSNFNYYSAENLIYGGYAASPTLTPVYPRENPTYAVVNGCLYWYAAQTGTSTVLFKYDGHCYYGVSLKGYDQNIGLDVSKPDGATVTDVKGTYTLNASSAYSYNIPNYIWIRFAYKDEVGFLHEGPFVEQPRNGPIAIAAATGAESLYRAANVLTYENARGAKVNGVQTGVTTITVDAGHKLLIGDVAYFWDSSTGFFVERKITNKGATSITIAGDAVDVYDNAIISNNFRIQYFIAKQIATYPSTYQLLNGNIIADIPYNAVDVPWSGFIDIYLGSETDTINAYGTLNQTYSFDGANEYPPPNGKFVTSASNGSTLLVAGDVEANNTVYCSTPTDPELFRIGRNSFTVDEKISGLGSSGSVNIVGTGNKIYAVTGDIPNLNFRVEKITENLGIDSAASVVEVDEGAIHFNSHNGPYALLGGRQLQPVGAWPQDKRLSLIEPYFNNVYPTITYTPQFHVASSYVIKERSWIITTIPWYLNSTYSFSSSGTFMFDYGIGGWVTWTGVDASCGAAYWDDQVWFAGQGAGGTINLVSMTEGIGDYGFNDHGVAISATIRMHWENGGNINLYKKYLWLTLHTPIGNGYPYNVNVITYANYEIAKANAFSIPVAPHTSFSKYTNPPAYTIEAKLKTGKMASLMLEINNSTVNEGLWYGGCEMDIAGDFETPSRPGRGDS